MVLPASSRVSLDCRARSYRRREPEDSALYVTLQQHLETFLATVAAAGSTVPRFVERELRAFLKCGVVAHGFARVRCDSCKHDRLVAFSCKGRGFCPSCGGKRMTRIAEHLAERVVPAVPVRQWVLTLPYRLRYRAAYDHALCRELLRLFSRALQASYRRRARDAGLPGGRTGAVTFIQRFGSALNLNPHFHTQVLDGVFIEGPDGALGFHPLPPPSKDEVAAVLEEVSCCLRPVLERYGLGDDYTVDELSDEEPVLAACYAGSVAQRASIGPRAGRGPMRIGSDPTAPFVDNRRRNHAQLDGFDLDASVHVPADAPERLEQLLRYCARPAISHERLRMLPDGRLQLELKSAWHDGTTHLVLQPQELIERLVALVPRPHKNLVVYHGVLAPNAKWRSRVAAYERSEQPTEAVVSPRKPGRPNTDWAHLMRRAFDLDVLKCPRCDGRMRVIALVRDTRVAQRILRHLGMRAHPPPAAPPRLLDDTEFQVA